MPVWRSRFNGDVKLFLSDYHLYIAHYVSQLSVDTLFNHVFREQFYFFDIFDFWQESLYEFDRYIVSALHATGGSNYTTIASLAWRYVGVNLYFIIYMYREVMYRKEFIKCNIF